MACGPLAVVTAITVTMLRLSSSSKSVAHHPRPLRVILSKPRRAEEQPFCCGGEGLQLEGPPSGTSFQSPLQLGPGGPSALRYHLMGYLGASFYPSTSSLSWPLTFCFKIGLFVLPEKKNAINISDFLFNSAEELQIL